MSHISTNTIEYDGVKVRAVIEIDAPDEDHVTVALVCDGPEIPTRDPVFYRAVVKKPPSETGDRKLDDVVRRSKREDLNTLHYECTCHGAEHHYPCPYSPRTQPGKICECVRSADDTAHSPTCTFFID